MLASKFFSPLGTTNDNTGVVPEWYENDGDVIPTYIDEDDVEEDLRERILEYLNLRKTINQLRENNPSNNANVDAENKWKTDSHRYSHLLFNTIYYPLSKKADRPKYDGQNSYYDVSDIIRL